MRIIFLLLITTIVINAKTLGVVIMNSRTANYDNNNIKQKLENFYLTQDENFLGTNKISVSIDSNMKIKKIFQQSGAKGIIEYATQKGYISIALVKKRARYFSITVIVADKKVQDKKSLSIPFTPDLSGDELMKTILSAVLTLNYELGVLHETTVY